MNLSKYGARIEQQLDKYLFDYGSLTEPMRYSVLNVGKRLRPLLTYEIADMFDTDINLADSSACAVEFVHIYSLIHDDLPAMDDDCMRHGKISCHKKFDEARAILTGDGLQTLAFKILAYDKNISFDTRIKLLQELIDASFSMVLGQAIDLSIVAKKVDESILKNIHQKKTGALLRCAVKLGAILSPKCSYNNFIILDSFAKDVGLAYQIQDDVLDSLAFEKALGKNKNSDKKKNKPSYLSLLGALESKKRYKKLYERAQQKLQNLSVNADNLKKLTNKLSVRRF